MEKIKKKKKVLKTYIYINSTLVAQLWDAGDISNCQLRLVRLRQQGEPEREREAARLEKGGGFLQIRRGSILGVLCCRLCSSSSKEEVGGGAGSHAGESSLQCPRTCRTSLTARSQAKTRISCGSPPPQDLSFCPKGSPPSFQTSSFL